MAGIDRFFSVEFSEIIKKKLDASELEKLEKYLFFENGMSIKLSMEYYDKFNVILKRIYSRNIEDLEKKWLNEICEIRKNKNCFIIKLKNEKIIHKLLKHLGDSESRTMLEIWMKDELTIPEMLNKSNIPKTSGYRKIDVLVADGIIVETRKILSESKKISKYRCIFDQIAIKIKKEMFVAEGIISKKEFDKSTMMKGIIKF